MSITIGSLNSTEAAQMLINGNIGVIPTDTVYGLACSAKLPEAVGKLYKIKNRDHKPGTIIAASINQLTDLGLKKRYLTAVQRFWPGAVSVVIPCVFELPYLHLGVGSLAVRVAADKPLVELLRETGPLLTSSANYPDKPESTTIAQAKDYFGDEVDFYVDGGDLSGRKASTVIRVVDDAIEILRLGAVRINEKGEIDT